MELIIKPNTSISKNTLSQIAFLRKGMAWFFLLLFFYYSIGSQLSVWVWKWQVQETLEERAKSYSNQALFPIKVGSNQSQEKEINFEGKMYDVIRVIEEGDHSVLLCVRDFTEEALLSSCADSFVNLMNQQFHQVLKLIKKVAAEKYFSVSQIEFKNTSVILISKFDIALKCLLLKAFTAIDCPPPEL